MPPPAKFLMVCLAVLSLAASPALSAAEPAAAPSAANAGLDPNKNVSQALASAMVTNHKTAGLTNDNGSYKSIRELTALYNESGAPFLEGVIGIGLVEFMRGNTFKTIFWGFVLLFSGMAATAGMKKAMAGSNPLGDLATLAVKLLFGSVLIAGSGIIFAILMTLMSSMTMALQKAREAGIARDVLDVGLSDTDFERTRNTIINEKAQALGVALGEMGRIPAYADMLEGYYKVFKDKVAPAMKDMGADIDLPAINLTNGLDGEGIGASEKATRAGEWLSANAPTVVSLMAGMPKGMVISTGTGGGIPALADRTPQSDAILLKKVKGAGANAATAHAAKVENYRMTLGSEVSNYITVNVLGAMPHDDTDANFVKKAANKLGFLLGAAANAVSEKMSVLSPANMLRAVSDSIMKFLQFTSLIVVSALTFIAQVLVEASLFVMVIMFPFWLHPGTEKAFTGPIKAMIAAALWVPAFQFAMIIVDGVYGFVMKMVLIGALLRGGVGMLGGPPAILAGAVNMALMVLAFAVIYFAITLVTALKTPGWIKMALEGGNLAGDFIMKQATSMAEGVLLAATLGTSAVALGAKGAAGAGAKGAAGAGAKGAAGVGASAKGAAGDAAGAAAKAADLDTSLVPTSRAPSTKDAPVEAGPATTPPLATPTKDAPHKGRARRGPTPHIAPSTKDAPDEVGPATTPQLSSLTRALNSPYGHLLKSSLDQTLKSCNTVLTTDKGGGSYLGDWFRQKQAAANENAERNRQREERTADKERARAERLAEREEDRLYQESLDVTRRGRGGTGDGGKG